ncbi:MAG: hypothetical protein ABSF91_14765 [Bacteroidota bacterium]|jgi:hypothetical protein
MRKAIFILVIMTLSSCKNNPTGPSLGTTEYFPLKVGNSWTYKMLGFNTTDTTEITMKVIDAISKNGKVYYQMDTTVPILGIGLQEYKTSYPLLLRNDEKGDVYSLLGDKESLFLKFSAPKDSSWYWYACDSCVAWFYMWSKNDTATIASRQYTNCIVMFQNLYTILSFCPGVGLVSYVGDIEVPFSQAWLESYSLK